QQGDGRQREREPRQLRDGRPRHVPGRGRIPGLAAPAPDAPGARSRSISGALRALAKPERRHQDLLRGGRIVTCREFADFIAAYLSGELAPDSRPAFELHLRLCVNCQKYLAGYEETMKLGKRAFADDEAAVPDQVPEELVQAILTARRAR